MLQGCTYNHLHCDWDGAVEGWASPVFGHYCQVDHPFGNLLIIQRPGHTDHWWKEGDRWRKVAICFACVLFIIHSTIKAYSYTSVNGCRNYWSTSSVSLASLNIHNNAVHTVNCTLNHIKDCGFMLVKVRLPA